MPQNSLLIQDGTGAQVLTRANGALEALQTQSSGDNEPTVFKPQQVWADTKKKMLRRRNAGNSAWVPTASLSDVKARVGSATSPVVESDFGLSVYCSGTYTQTLPPTADVFPGWHCDIVNVGPGVVTLSAPSATINSAATAQLKSGESAKVQCTESGKYVLQRYAAEQATGGAGAVVGSIIMFAGQKVPDGYLVCDGTAVSKATYAALYTAIGDSWGSATDTSKFLLPDCLERTFFGVSEYPSVEYSEIGYFKFGYGDAVDPIDSSTITRSLPPTTSQTNVFSLRVNQSFNKAYAPNRVNILPCIKY